MQSAKPGTEAAFTFPVRPNGGNLAEMGAVHHLEMHRHIRLGIPLLVRHLHGSFRGQSIASQVIQHMAHILHGHHLQPGACLSQILVIRLCGQQPAGMNQHGPGRRTGKPSPVHHLLRLAGSQEDPFSVRPCLYPGVIVVTVGPQWHIHLPGRDP